MSGTQVGTWVGRELAHGRYRVDAQIGEGGMGTVFRAWDNNLGTDVVIKAPHPSMMQDAEFASRFTRETGSLVKLSHPHIVKISDVGESDGVPFAVMQFLPGGSLEDRLKPESAGDGRPLPAESLKSWLVSIAEALDFVHQQGYIHRDVKPANILFDSHGHSYLSDFGIAKSAVSGTAAGSARTLTGSGMVLGTPEYMAPELILGQPCDGRVDQYALAVTVFEILAGRRPFEDATSTAVLVQHSTKEPPDLTSLIPDVLPGLAAAIRKALSKSPNDRFANCRKFADAVLAAVASAPKSGEAKAKCPACQRLLKLADKVRGKEIVCPACKTKLRVSDDLRQLSESKADNNAATDGGGTRAVAVRKAVPNVLQESEDTYGLAVESGVATRPESETMAVGQPTSRTKAIQSATVKREAAEKPTNSRLSKPKISDEKPPFGKTRLLIAGGMAAGVLMLGITIFVLTSRGSVKITVMNSDDSAQITVDGDEIAITGLDEPLKLRVGEHALTVTSPRFETVTQSFKVTRGDTTVVEVTLQPKPSSAPGIAKSDKPGATPLEKPAVYSVELDPSQATFSVEGDGVTVTGSGPKRTVSVVKPQPDKPIVLVARLQNFQEARRKLRPAPGASEVIVLKLSPETTGEPKPAILSTNDTESISAFKIQLDPDQTIYQRSILRLGGSLVSVSDDLQSALIADVDFGDGRATEPIDLAPDLTFQLEHVYSEPGEYAVTVVVSDGKAAPLRTSATVTAKELTPVPDAAALQRSRTAIRNLYKKEFSDANKSTATKLAWAENLIEYGLQTADAPTERYVVFDEAAMQAIEVPDPSVAFRAIDEIAKTFDINPHVKKAELLALTVEKTKPASLSLHKRSVDAGLAAFDDALNNNDFTAAHDLLKAAQKAAELGKDVALLKKVTSASEKLTARAAEWDQFTKAKETLEAMPDDPDCNQAVGYYLCFTKGQWHQGMPHLTKSPNPKVSSLATTELERRHSVSVMLTLADCWFSLADESEGEVRSQMRARALYWYKAVAPQLSGVSQQRVDQIIRTHDPKSRLLPRKWKLVQSLHKDGANGEMYGLALSPDGNLLATGDSGQTLRVWDVNNGKIRKEIRNYRPASSEVQSPVFLKDGKRFLFVFGRHHLAELWSIDKDKPLALFENDPNSETYFVALSPNEEMLALTGKNGIVTLRSAETGQPIRKIEHGLSGVPFIAFSADNKRIVCGAENSQAISLCDCATGQKVGALMGHTGNVIGVACGRKGKIVASAARDGTIRIWSASSEKQLRQCEPSNVPIRSLAMSSDERLIATGLNDGSVAIWDSDTGRRLDLLQANLVGHVDRVTFSLDGRRVAAAGEGNNSRVWQAVYE